MIADGELLEWARPPGAPATAPPPPRRAGPGRGRPAMLEIDLQGARQVRETMPEALFVFLKPPSWDELYAAGRPAPNPRRNAPPGHRARLELAAEAEFDVTIVNHEVHAAADELVALMTLDLEQPPSTTVRLTRVFAQHRRRGCHQPLDRRPAHQDRQQVQAGPTAKRARQINAYYSQLGEGLLEYVGPLVDTHVQEKPLSICAPRDQRGPADLRGRRPCRARRRGGRRQGSRGRRLVQRRE